MWEFIGNYAAESTQHAVVVGFAASFVVVTILQLLAHFTKG